MNFLGDVERLGTVPIAGLQSVVEGLDESRWLEDQSRQELFQAHASTSAIKLIFDADYRHHQPTRHPAFDEMLPHIAPVLDLVRAHHSRTLRQRRWIARHGEGYFVRILLTRLRPGGRIAPHCDGGYSLSRCHRVHVPVRTNPLCRFQVGDTALVMQPGEVWEINNRLMHAVENDGDTARVHLIVDYVQPGETILDRDGTFTA